MPRMQGRELADKIRVLRPGIRVAFMSGYTQGLLSQQRVLEPGVYLIEKPFTETTFSPESAKSSHTRRLQAASTV
jgi:FixJ family two-component response regulator